MMRTSPFRSLIALLLAAWTPFCCCNLHSLMNVCQACGKHDHCGGVAVDNDDDEHPMASDTHMAMGHQHGHEHAVPTQPDKPKHDEKPCTCDQTKLTPIGLYQVSIDFPIPTVLYVLPEWELSWSPHWRSLAQKHENRSPLRPATSLLLQHCALIV